MMLFTALLTATLSAPAFAVDTSGCSQLLRDQKSAPTPAGIVDASYERAPRDNCWNANEAALTVRYRFFAKGENPSVSFYVNLNGQNQTLTAKANCQGAGSAYGKDTRNDRTLACTATLSLPTRAGRQELEIAPSVNGIFDTQGYGQNVRLSF